MLLTNWTFSLPRFLSSLRIPLLISLVAIFASQFPVQSATQATERPTPPTRDPHSAGYVAAKDLPDGAIPSADSDGNFILGPTHNADPLMSANNDLPHGTVIEFTMNSADSKIYPGIARDPNTFGTVDPADPAKLIITT